MTVKPAPRSRVTLDLKAKFAELEARRRFHLDGVDHAVEAEARLLALDRQLVEDGFHDELQLDHGSKADVPVRDLLEFHDDEPAVGSAPRPPPDPAEATSVPTGKALNGRRFSPEQKAEAVRLGDELGSDSAAAKQIGTTPTSIVNWRKAGHGKRPEPRASASAIPGEPSTPVGPQTKCKVCKTSVPIEGPPSQVSRVAALRRHYEDFPQCDAVTRRAGR